MLGRAALPALLWLSVLAGCAADRPPNLASVPARPAEVDSLLAALPPDANEVAGAYVRHRPVVARDITALSFEQRDDSGRRVALTRLVIRPLPNGLEHYRHQIDDAPENPDPERMLRFEQGVTLAGNVASFAYANDRPAGTPWITRVHAPAAGDATPYGAEAWSVVSTRSSDGTLERYACRRDSERPAGELHPALRGRAVLYACRSDLDSALEVLKWYLVDHARYVPAGTRDEGVLAITFHLTGVWF